ncbi:hypothetical protein [Mariniphaga sp.]|uniref:hypothetical protein n=1 Tax=Mariniphaga sp. TaxID=1954475 RepID=UPI003569AB78
MKTLQYIFGAIITGLLLTSCDKETDNLSTVCDQTVIVSKEKYNTAPNDQLTINSAEINADCLEINFASSGCSGSSWEVKLIDSGIILYSNPPQRNLRLSLKNQELCDAYIGKEITFDVKDLQVDGNKVLLNITNSGDQILYEY